MRLAEIKQLLKAGQIQLTRSLGQCFMHDQNQLRRIVAAAALEPTDQVLEIGPGLGPLTELLVESAAHVLAIEMDARLLEILRRRLSHVARLELVEADALQWLRAQPRDWSNWKLVSNLPYSCASPILVELAQAPRGPISMVTTLQLEVAQRLEAAPGSAHYGLLTTLVQCTYQSAGSFRIPAGCFFPEPNVDSACLALHRRAKPLISEAARRKYMAVVKRAFSQRRKMIAKLLKQDWPADRLAVALAAADIEPTQRAEVVSPEQFARLTEALIQSS